MPNNTKTRQIKKVVSQIIEPFALGILALLFIIPTLTVINLTPITKKLEDLNVLGATAQSNLSLTLIEGTHDIFKSEKITKTSENTYTYNTQLSKRSADNYSKPIIEISNNSTDVKKVQFYGQTKVPTNTNLFLIINNQSYRIQDDKGFTYPQEFEIYPGETQIIFLSIESLSGVQFNEEFNMEIKEIETL